MAPLKITWRKMGRIYVPPGDGFFKTHATRPIPFVRRDGTLRLIFSSRGADDMPYPTLIDLDPGDPSRVLKANTEPMMLLGRVGAFDDSGATPVSILRHDGEDRVYYVGWKRRRWGVTIESTIGLALLRNDGDEMTRVFEGPILGQDIDHPILTAAPFAVFEDGRYKMWYCSGDEWRQASGQGEPIYTVHYAESNDGIRWQRKAGPVIPYKFDGEVVSAPWVVRIGGGYHMWYSTRGFTTRETKNYTVGYAHSTDGIHWERRDDLAGITRSETGWDSEMVCYPALHPRGERVYMFYCGNAVGRGGIGYAVADNFLN
jgi:hypothetical protein